MAPEVPYEKFARRFHYKSRKEGIVKPIIGNESPRKANNDNGVRVVNFATSKNLIVRAQHSHTATFINTFRLLLIVSHIITQIIS
jgi:hypothetical protein